MAQRPVRKATAKKTAAKKATPPRPATRPAPAPTASPEEISARHAADTAALQQEEELPLLVVKSAPRPRARLQLGPGGPIYIVTRPKDAVYMELGQGMKGLSALVADEAGADQINNAVDTLRQFVLAVFNEDDAEQVLEHLSSNDNDTQIQDLADAMIQLMEGPWAVQDEVAA